MTSPHASTLDLASSHLAPAPSAAGAPFDQVLVVAAFTGLVYAALLWVIYRERTGHRTLVGVAADRVAALDRSPRWFALPMAVTILGALAGGVGLYWDVSYHIAHGRDEGPLANPAHYFIFLGLLTIFAGSVLGMALSDSRHPEDLPRRVVPLGRRWLTPVGPAMGTAISLCALLGFPLDDIWHRLFGQDVTEWGPTHVLMIGGTLMLPYAVLLKCAEARQVSRPRSVAVFEAVGLLVIAVGPVAFLLEFAYGTPQFPLINDPVVLTVAAVMTFVLAALRGARWVVVTWLGYAAVHGLLVALNVWAFDALTPWPPLLLGGALAALPVARFARATPAYGALAGVVVTAGMLAVEWPWTEAIRPVPWPAAMMPWAALFCAVTGAGVGVVAVWMHRQLVATAAEQAVPARSRSPWPGRVALAGALAVVAVFVVNVPPTVDRHGTVDVTVDPVAHTIDGARAGYLDVRVDPALVRDSYWFQALAWQGGGAVHGRLLPEGPGHYRTDVPMPLSGKWKTLIRLHTPLHSMLAAPVYLPADKAIPVPAYPAVDGARPFVEEKTVLRREEKPGVPAWLWDAAYAVVGGLFLLLFAFVAVGYAAAARGAGRTLPLPRPVRRLAGVLLPGVHA
ncbi:MAG: hypothetical protein ACXVW6_05305 [Nocardioidaceae bacterium]